MARASERPEFTHAVAITGQPPTHNNRKASATDFASDGGSPHLRLACSPFFIAQRERTADHSSEGFLDLISHLSRDSSIVCDRASVLAFSPPPIAACILLWREAEVGHGTDTQMRTAEASAPRGRKG